MIRLISHEFFDVVSRPVLWIGMLAFGVFLIHVVGHMAVDDEGVRVGIYATAADDDERLATLGVAETLFHEMSGINMEGSRKVIASDVAAQALVDNIDIAVARTDEGWRFLIRSRSGLEHSRFVRTAQVLGATLSQQRPWPLIAYEALQSPASDDAESKWPTKVQISGTTADPGRHARVFVPKTVALLSFLAAFVFACRSMIRDTGNNMLLSLLTASRSNWTAVMTAKISVASFFGLVSFLTLLLFATLSEAFNLKEGLITITLIQSLGLITSALLGIACALLAKSESRIYLIASGYLILLVLLSGMIAKIQASERFLYWISRVVPLGYAMDILSDWMFFGVVPPFNSNSIQIMAALLLLATTITLVSVLYRRKQV